MSHRMQLVMCSAVALIAGGVLGYVARGAQLASGAAPRATPTSASPASTTITIKGSDLDALLASPDETMRMARLVPNMRDGSAHGMRVAGIRPDTMLATSGILNGDVVVRLNGFDLGAPESFLSAAQSLRGSSAFDLDIERHSAPMRLHYVVER